MYVDVYVHVHEQPTIIITERVNLYKIFEEKRFMNFKFRQDND